MAILKVVQIGNPVLREHAQPIDERQLADEALQRVLADLVDTMREYGGVGLAAPQVRVPLRAFVMEIGSSDRYPGREPLPLHVVVNPELEPLDDRVASDWEGCLSIAGLRGRVPRLHAVRLRGLTPAGEPFARTRRVRRARCAARGRSSRRCRVPGPHARHAVADGRGGVPARHRRGACARAGGPVMGTLMPGSPHPMIRLLSEHQAAMESLRAAYGELSAATALLQDAAERVFIDVDDGAQDQVRQPARHEMPVSKTTDFLAARRAFENAALAQVLLPQSLLVAMVSQHDAFIGGLLRAIFALRPDLRGRIRRPVSLSELGEVSDVEALGAKLVEDEIRDVLRSSHSAQLTWIAELLTMRLDSDPKLLARFQEVVQRRHLYAHNGGIVNAKYVDVRGAVESGFAGVPGDRLPLSAGEFEAAFDVLMEIAIKLWQVTWRKACKHQLDQAEEALYRLGYELLVFERFELARRVLEFAVSMPIHAQESVRRKNIVNLAQCCKWLGDEDGCRRALAGHWSAYEESFTLAIAVLEERYEDAERLMLRVGGKGDIVQQAFLDWPLFRRFRRTKGFARAYAQLFDRLDDEVA